MDSHAWVFETLSKGASHQALSLMYILGCPSVYGEKSGRFFCLSSSKVNKVRVA